MGENRFCTAIHLADGVIVGHDGGPLLPLDLDGAVGNQVQAVALDLLDVRDDTLHADAGADLDRRGEPHLVEAVVDLGLHVGHIEQLGPEANDKYVSNHDTYLKRQEEMKSQNKAR